MNQQGWEKCWCGSSHHVSVRLEHETHHLLKKIAKASSSKSMGAFIAKLISDKIEERSVVAPQLRRRIKVRLSDLQNAKMKDLREFADNHGIQANKKREIISEIYRAEHINLIEDVEAMTVRCSCCLQLGHNIQTCPYKFLRVPVKN